MKIIREQIKRMGIKAVKLEMINEELDCVLRRQDSSME